MDIRDIDDIPEEEQGMPSEVRELRETFYGKDFSSKSRIFSIKEVNKLTMLKFWLEHYRMPFLVEPLIGQNLEYRISVGGQGRKEIFGIHTPLATGTTTEDKKPRKKLFSFGGKKIEKE
jgi:hypothetical protein